MTKKPTFPNGFPIEVTATIGAFAIVRQLEMKLDETRFETELTKQELRMIAFLDPPRRMGDMAEVMGALPSSVTAISKALERRDLVRKERDPDDGRVWRLALTDSGSRARKEIFEKVSLAFREVSGLSAEETEEFARLATRALPADFKKGMSWREDT